MRLSFLVLIFTIKSVGAELSYKSLELQPAPLNHLELLTQVFKEHDYATLVDPLSGISSLGINQVFYKNQDQFVLVKYGIEGSVTEGVVRAPAGVIVHKKMSGKMMALYFRGFNEREFEDLHKKVVSLPVARYRPTFKNAFISEAHAASECETPKGPSSDKTAANVTGVISLSMLKSCLSGVGEGAWDGTAGMFIGLGKGILKFASDPVGYLETAADKIGSFLTATNKFVKTLIADPNKAFSMVGNGLGATWDKIKAVVSGMSPAMKVNFVCSLIGGLGINAAIVFFTGGAGTAKLLVFFENVLAKFSKIQKLMATLGKLNSALMTSVNLNAAKLEKFMKKLISNKIPEEDLVQLEAMTKNSSDLSLKVLSCYIH